MLFRLFELIGYSLGMLLVILITWHVHQAIWQAGGGTPYTPLHFLHDVLNVIRGF